MRAGAVEKLMAKLWEESEKHNNFVVVSENGDMTVFDINELEEWEVVNDTLILYGTNWETFFAWDTISIRGLGTAASKAVVKEPAADDIEVYIPTEIKLPIPGVDMFG